MDGTSFVEPQQLDIDLQLLQAKNEILELIARGAGLDRVLRNLAAIVQRLSAADMCAVGLLDDDGFRFDSIHGLDIPDRYRNFHRNLQIESQKTPCAISACKREPVVSTDIAEDKRFVEFAGALKDLSLRSCWSQPILDRDGESMGTIALLFEAPRTPSNDELRVVDALCPLARLAIEHGRRAEALQKADNRFASVAASIPGVVYQRVVSPDGDIRYTYISEGARDLFGVEPEEIVSNPTALFDRHSPEYSANFRERLLAASRDLTMWDVEAPIITRDGERKWTHAIARPHRRPDGSVVWDGVILDATRIKQTNLELTASNRAKSEFLANMSHELRTPLNAIIGLAEVMHQQLLGEIGNSRYREYVGDIHNSGVHLMDIINDILDLAKIESGKLELMESIVDIRRIFESCVRIVQPRADEGGVSLSVNLPDQLPRLRADERKLKQVMINLLSNAIKFSVEGGNVRMEASVSDDNRIMLIVSDDGIGIPREQVASVFEPFTQVDSGLDRGFQGTGLGLPLTKAMVELHGGGIGLESEKGVGTVVTVSMPRDKSVFACLSNDDLEEA